MDLSIILMIAGIVLIVVSFFFKNTAKKVEQDVEELSISIFQETNNLKRRLKIVEEELLLEPDFQVKSPVAQNQPLQNPKMQQVMQAVQQAAQATKSAPTPQQTKPIHQIIISQVLELNKQGLSIADISIRSNLTEEQVRQVIANGGR
ncbi:LAS superfamily LD-carboxypeptidase LdcB [Lysinibacillus parviboronicapiens]|uniref:LAS superfamily LD-carboxypeptidase LdcB n=1 Tax=Lysinibacillus parviboronicapiens TaxID=436516 RepID=A0ABV2PHU8_9BACI